MKAMCFVRILRVMAATIVLGVATTDVFAATRTWDNGAHDGGLWVTPANWSSNLAPIATDDAWIDTANTYVQIRPGDAAVGKQVLVGRSSSGIELEMTGGTLTTSTGSPGGLYVGQYGGSSGILRVSGGTINAALDIDIGYTGSGMLVMTGGTINVGTNFILNTYGGLGHVDFSGGTINCNSLSINSNSVFNISNTGVLIINGDKMGTISGYIGSSPAKLIACNGAGTVLYDYDTTNPGKTTVRTSCTVETSPGVSNPSPANAATEIPIEGTQLSWTPGSVSATSFRVYLGISVTAVFTATPASAEYMGVVTSPTFDPGTLVKGTKYYWRIDELNSGSQVISTGPLWWFQSTLFDPTALGPIVVTPDWTGVRSDIPAAPAAGQHPRIYFSSADKAAIASRWTNTNSGKEAKAQLYAYVRLMELGYSAYNALPTTAGGIRRDAYGHERILNIGYSDARIWYVNLVNGEANPLAEVDPRTGFSALTDTTKLDTIPAQMALMALYYYITDSTAGLQEVATATFNWLDSAHGNRAATVMTAYVYDMAYNVMTTTQRDAIRLAIYNYIKGRPFPYGTYTEAYSTTSNWVGLSAYLYLTCMGIEGETATGVDPVYVDTYKSYYRRAQHNFLTYGFYPSGIGWEGQGKNYIWATGLVAWARRGESFIAYPNVHAYGQNYLPSIMQPFGYAFEAYDAWGGTGTDATYGGYKFATQDAAGLKWIFPNDPKVDFMYRNYMQYREHSGSYNYAQFSAGGYDSPLFTGAIFASEYSTATWNQGVLPTTSFYDEEGLMITRSDDATTALGLQFFCRQNFGGHTHGDRNNINLSALGRTWGIYRTDDGSGPLGYTQETKYKSCTLIDVNTVTGDGYGIPLTLLDGYKSRQPGKVVDFFDGDKATFASGDATYAYSWEWYWGDSNKLSQGWTMATETLNDFRPLNPGTEYYFDIPFYDYADWVDYPDHELITKRASSRQMSYVYRTAGIVRGSSGNKPYALIVDDAKVADGLNHNFWWQMQLPDYTTTVSNNPSTGTPVLSIESSTINRVPTGYRCDVILKEPASTGNRRLLVRVFQNEGFTGTPAFIFNRYKFDSPSVTKSPWTLWPALIVESTNCLDPRTKVLLYPHYSGDALPTTNWDGTNLTVTIGSQIDTFKFNVGSDNRTRFTMLRNGCPFVPGDGDINRSGQVDFVDYANLAQTWPACHNFTDLATIAAYWLE
jgi:hypothetical protein